MTAAFDFDTLTLGEVATIEDLSGLPISAIADEERPKGKALAALAMIIKRRSGEPTFTFNQALAMPLVEANGLLGSDEPEDEAPKEPTPKRSAKNETE